MSPTFPRQLPNLLSSPVGLAGLGGAWQWGRVGGGGGCGPAWSQNGAAWEHSQSHRDRGPGRKHNIIHRLRNVV